MKKCALIITMFFMIFQTYAQEENIVTIIGSGSGLNETEATNAALRSCIEKAFGVFVSATTEIENDQLVKDKIATIGSGTINKYEVISVLKVKNGLDVTVSAQVSPSKIVNIIKAEGYDVKINGSVYAQNAMKEEYYKSQELEILTSFFDKYYGINFFDFEFSISEPAAIGASEEFAGADYEYRLMIKKYYDDAIDNCKGYLKNCSYSMSMSNTCYGSSSRRKKPHYGFGHSSWYWDDSLKFIIRVLAIPTPNANYATFVRSFVDLLSEIRIIDEDNFKKNVGSIYYVINQNVLFEGGITERLRFEEAGAELRKDDVDNYLKRIGMVRNNEKALKKAQKYSLKNKPSYTKEEKEKFIEKKYLEESKMADLQRETNLPPVYGLRNEESRLLITDFFRNVYYKSTSLNLSSPTYSDIKNRYRCVFSDECFTINKLDVNNRAVYQRIYPYVYSPYHPMCAETFMPTMVNLYLTMAELNSLQEIKFETSNSSREYRVADR